MSGGDAKSWEEYWSESKHRSVYATIARFYRRSLISRMLRHYFQRYFQDEMGRVYLHAGCGSGESDNRIGFGRSTFVLMDILVGALEIARAKTTLANAHFVVGDIFHPPFREASIDGIWNLGVMEHFYEPQISQIFCALSSILKPTGRGLILWPPRYGTSVIGLRLFLFLTNRILRRKLQLQPDEVALYWTRGWVRRLLQGSGLTFERSHFTFRDFWTYVILVVTKPGRS